MADFYRWDFPKSSGSRIVGNRCYKCDNWIECEKTPHMGLCTENSDEEYDIFTEQNDSCGKFVLNEDYSGEEHSERFDTVKSYYDRGLWSEDRVHAAVDKWITKDEAYAILGGAE